MHWLNSRVVFALDDPNFTRLSTIFSSCTLSSVVPYHQFLCYLLAYIFSVDYYDEIIANQMIIGTIAFVEGTFIEPRTMGPDVQLNKHATLFPAFVRNFSGMCGFYAWGAFTKDIHPDSVRYIQVGLPPLDSLSRTSMLTSHRLFPKCPHSQVL